jgi:uncharacterized RDD family membrane protein YckC
MNDRHAYHAPAPLGKRFLAFVIDAVIGGLALAILVGGFLGLSIASLGAPYWGLDALARAFEETSLTTFYVLFALWLLAAGLCFVWLVAYGLLRDAFGTGQSWGKRLLGLRVISSETHLPCGRQASLMRNLPGLSSTLVGILAGTLLPICGLLPLLVEPLAVIASEDYLRLGDRWARTRVVAIIRETIAPLGKP